MAQKVVGDAVAWPQDDGFAGIGDDNERWSSAGYFAALARMVGTSGFKQSGLGFSGHDSGSDQVDLDPGRCFVIAQTGTMQVDVQSSVGGTAEPSYDTTLQGAIPILIEIPSTVTNLDVQDSTLSDVWVAYDNDGTGPGSAGSVYVQSDDTGSVTAPSHPSVKVGSANPDDASADTSANDNPIETFEKATINNLVDGSGVSHTGELSDLADLFTPALNVNFPFPKWQMEKSSGGGSVTFTDRQIQLREPGNASAAEESRAYDEHIEFDPSVSGRIRIQISNITIDDNDNSHIKLQIDDTPDTDKRGSNVLEARVRGGGKVAAITTSGGTASVTEDTSQNNAYIASLDYIEISWDGSTLTVKTDDGSTTVTVSDSGEYPSGQTLRLVIKARDNSTGTARTVDFDVDSIPVGS